jgi:hypothetical protein
MSELLSSPEAEIRRATFDWLRQQVAIHDDIIPRSVLQEGFQFSD